MGRLESRLNPATLFFVPALLAAALGVGALAGRHPEVAVAVSLAFAFVFVVLGDLTLGLSCFAVLTFLEQLTIAGPALSFSKVAGLLLATSWFAVMTTRERASRESFITEHPSMTTILLMFLAWTALSSAWAELPSAALLDTTRFALNIVLFVIVFTAVRSVDDTTTVIAGVLIGALITAIFGILNPPAPESAIDASRISSTIGDPNELAILLDAGFILSIGAVAIPGKHPLLRLLAPIAAGACLLALFLTVSRGGLIALGVALIAAIVVGGRWRPLLLAGAVALGLAAFAYFAYLAPPIARDRIESVSSGQARQAEGRTTIWQIGWRMFEANPVKGVGASNFQNSSIHYLLQPGATVRSDQIVDEPAIAHNTYLQTIAELGVVGGIGLLAIFSFGLSCAWRAARLCARIGEQGLEILSRALIVALVATYVGDFFITNQYSKQLWLLLGLAPAYLAIARRREQALQAAPGS
jgi:O-antigen ligase